MPSRSHTERAGPAWIAAVLALVAAGGAAAGARAQSVSFSTQDLTLRLGPDGKVVSIVDRLTGRDRVKSTLPQYQNYLCELSAAGRTCAPTSFAARDGLLVFRFDTLSPPPVVSIRVRSDPLYVLFELADVQNPDAIESIRFVGIWTADSLDRVVDRVLRFDDGRVERYLGLHPLDPFTEVWAGPGTSGGYLKATAYARLDGGMPPALARDPFRGRRAVLFAANTAPASFVKVFEQIERDFDVPLGWKARQQPVLRQSTIFWSYFDASSPQERRRAIEVTRRAGCAKALLFVNLWADRANRYQPEPAWGGMQTLKDWIREAHDAGLLVGAHMLHTVGVTRGPVGPGDATPVRRDAAGQPIRAAEGPGYQLDLWNGGVAWQSRQIAAVFSEAGFDYLYADALEDVPESYWCSTAVAVAELYEALKAAGAPPRWMEGSAHNMNGLWPYIAVHGQTDWYLHKASFREEVNRNVRDMTFDARNPAPRQMGWAPICHTIYPETTPDELEYLLSRSLAWDVPVVYIMWGHTVNAWTHRDANLHLMYLYEKLRIEQYFSAELRRAARQADRDFMLFPDDGGHRLIECAPLSTEAAAEVPHEAAGGARTLRVALRAFASRGVHAGQRYVSAWAQPLGPDGKPVMATALAGAGPPRRVEFDGLRLQLAGLRADGVRVCDIWGREIAPRDDDAGLVLPFSTRVYLKLPATCEPAVLFRSARLVR
jgi:hypothetical protein